MFPFHHGETAFSPYFSQLHHGHIFRCPHSPVSPIKGRVTATGQDPPPGPACLKTIGASVADSANLLRYLITAQVFPVRLIVVQPVVSQRISLRANKDVLVQHIGKTILSGESGNRIARDVSGNAK